MIYTFYGYKGGVGRTLALVHSASLLASTRAQTGVRVLVIDLDLEAPGSIEFYLKPADGEAADRGFSELLLDYLEGDGCDAETLRERIEATCYRAADSLFVLGSGSREKASYLDASRLLPDAFEAGFFSKLRTACEAFEYVLVDARTGLADPATAATVLLGDVLVPCFRPSRASLGIGEILRQFLAANDWTKNDPRAQIVPLLTPRPAYYSPEAREWANFYQREYFGMHEIIQIPFDPILQVGERLLIPPGSVAIRGYGGGVLNLNAQSDIDIDAPLVTAYVALMDRLATFNTTRDIVAARQAEVRAYGEKRYEDGLDFLFRIIRHEPDHDEHWQAILGRYQALIEAQPHLRDKVTVFLRESSEGVSRIASRRGRAWLHIIRAQFLGHLLADGGERECDRALELAGSERDDRLVGLANLTKAAIALQRAGSEMQIQGESRQRMILRHLDAAALGLGNTATVAIARGDALRQMERYDDAILAYDDAAKTSEIPATALIAAGRTLEFVGRYGDALRRYRTAAEHARQRDLFVRYAYLLAALEHFSEAEAAADDWVAIRPRDEEPYIARIMVRIIRGVVNDIIAAIESMDAKKTFFVPRNLRVGLAIRQRLFNVAADIATETAEGVDLFLRCYALLAAGKDIRHHIPASLDGREAPLVALAGLLAGQHSVVAALKPARARATSRSARWRAMLELVDVLDESRRGINARHDAFLAATVRDADVAVYLRNQPELRLANIICESTSPAVDRDVAARLSAIFEVWDDIAAKPLDAFPPLRLTPVAPTTAPDQPFTTPGA